MNVGMRSMRAAASGAHAGPAGAASAVEPKAGIIAAKGQPGPSAPAATAAAPSGAAASSTNAASRWWVRLARTCSKGAASGARPPTLTPRVRTSWVSQGLVNMATRWPQAGQPNVTVSEPSSGPAVDVSLIASSHAMQRNFIVRLLGNSILLGTDVGTPARPARDPPGGGGAGREDDPDALLDRQPGRQDAAPGHQDDVAEVEVVRRDVHRHQRLRL